MITTESFDYILKDLLDTLMSIELKKNQKSDQQMKKSIYQMHDENKMKVMTKSMNSITQLDSMTQSTTSSITTSSLHNDDDISDMEMNQIHDVLNEMNSDIGTLPKMTNNRLEHIFRYIAKDLLINRDNTVIMVHDQNFVFVHENTVSTITSFLSKITEVAFFFDNLHVYRINEASLNKAFLVGLTKEYIIKQLNDFAYHPIPSKVELFIYETFQRVGIMKILLENTKIHFECNDKKLLEEVKSISEFQFWVQCRYITISEVEEYMISSQSECFLQADIFSQPLPISNHSKSLTTFRLSVWMNTLLQQQQQQQQQQQSFNYLQETNKSFLPLLVCVMKRIIINKLNLFVNEECKIVDGNLCTTKIKSIINVRDYQYQTLSHLISEDNQRFRSGIIEMPCGSGKTLIAILAMTQISGISLVLTNNNSTVKQFRNAILQFTNIEEERIWIFNSKAKQKKALEKMTQSRPTVILMTYAMIGNMLKPNKKNNDEFYQHSNSSNSSSNKSIKNYDYNTKKLSSFSSIDNDDYTISNNIFCKEELKKVIRWICQTQFHLVIYDEVHMAAAETFSNAAKHIKAMWKIGLSATLVREDNKTVWLDTLIGPKLFEVSWIDLIKKRYLANVKCWQINCVMCTEFVQQMIETIDQKKIENKTEQALINFELNKIMICLQLVMYHLRCQHKIIIFGDSKNGMEIYQTYLEHLHLQLIVPIINSDTSENDREKYIQYFRDTDECNCIIFGRVGETGIDIPDANIIIQIDQQGKCRRQEAQRVGRIMRISEKCPLNVFYSLVSVISNTNKNTSEYREAKMRQTFLEQRGIRYHEHFIQNGTIQNEDFSILLGDSLNEKNINMDEIIKYNTPENRKDQLISVLKSLEQCMKNI